MFILTAILHFLVEHYCINMMIYIYIYKHLHTNWFRAKCDWLILLVFT